MNIDQEMQRRFSGIKPMDEQFPGAKLEKKLMESPSKGTSTIAVMNGKDILMGQRSDNGNWTFPGGGLNSGEDPHAGAIRELFEEAGIRAKKLDHLVSKVVDGRTGEKVMVHCYKLPLSQKLQSNSFNDPDAEVKEWKWIDTSNGLPDDIMGKLQSPKNLLLQALGLQSDMFRDEIRGMK